MVAQTTFFINTATAMAAFVFVACVGAVVGGSGATAGLAVSGVPTTLLCRSQVST